MNDLKNWYEVTRGILQYVIAAKACYEIHVLHWDFEKDILTAKASLYLVGSWTNPNGSFFEREPILTEQPVFECLKAAEKDIFNNVGQ